MLTFVPSPGTGDLLENPNFVNPSEGNYALASTSPLINAGQFGYDMGAISYAARPCIPTNLQVVTQPNQFNVQLTWINPTENTDGTSLTSISGVQIYRNDILIASVNGMVPGHAGQYNDVTPIQGENRYRILAITSASGLYAFTRELWIGPPTTALDPGPECAAAPENLVLRGARPNPFNPSTVASFELQVASYVSLRVYDTAGRLVATLVNGWRAAGSHEVTFDGTGLPSGIYLLRLEAGKYSAVQKLTLLK